MSRAGIKKGDMVKVISGDEKGKTGKVLKVFAKDGNMIIEKINLIKRHTRADGRKQQQGGIVEREEAISRSKVVLFCPRCSQPARLGKKVLADGGTIRICKSCGEMVRDLSSS